MELFNDPHIYQLNTVTYGTGCAAYLAIRTLHQLGKDEGADLSQAARALVEDTYVDDFITGADTVKTALQLRAQLTELLSRAGLELKKWTSNSSKLLASIPEADQEPRLLNFLSSEEVSVKILGLMWSPTMDHFPYNINPLHTLYQTTNPIRDCTYLRDLGWLMPTTFVAKQLLQELRKLRVHWDEDSPQSIQNYRNQYQNQLPNLKDISIPRKIKCNNIPATLAGFYDASEAGYAAVVYLCWQHDDRIFKTALLMAKSRVAPLKGVSTPRFELCAVVLLSKAIAHLTSSLKHHVSKIYVWSDSKVALEWIQPPAYRWKTFVSNQVAEIQRHLSSELWHYVKGQKILQIALLEVYFLANWCHINYGGKDPSGYVNPPLNGRWSQWRIVNLPMTLR